MRLHRRMDCRLCRSTDLVRFLDFGPMPLAGGFLSLDDHRPPLLFPLDVAFCRACSLVQVPNVVPGEVLFREYFYLSSVIRSLSNHFVLLADEIAEILRRRPVHLVVEIGSNDGVLLVPLRDRGLTVLGVDASENVTRIARSRGVDVIQSFFTEATGRAIAAERRRADVIVASNVFAHVDDVDEIMQGIDALLAPNGVFLCEVHYLLDLLEGAQFDTIYHEHLNYYSLTALVPYFEKFGMVIADVVRHAIHAGSVRLYVRRRATAELSSRVRDLLEVERRAGIADEATYAAFALRAALARDRIQAIVREVRGRGCRVVGYGAAGRGTMLLNYCGLGHDQVEYVVDESPLRKGRRIPGVDIPIVGPEVFRNDAPDYALILAWNCEREIREKEGAFLARGGRFIVPLPEVRLG